MVVIVIVQDCLKEETKSDKTLPVYGLEGIFPYYHTSLLFTEIFLINKNKNYCTVT